MGVSYSNLLDLVEILNKLSYFSEDSIWFTPQIFAARLRSRCVTRS